MTFLADESVSHAIVVRLRDDGWIVRSIQEEASGTVDPTVLGSAVAEEGLVYVEAAPGSGRRLWFVDPSTPGADGDACRQVVPVQQL